MGTNEHYYTADPTTAHDLRQLTYTIAGRALRLESDAGVFAKEGVDFGSRLLVDTILANTKPCYALDLGCGYGPIGLALAAMGFTMVMSDINNRAVALAQKNAQYNGLTADIVQADGCEGLDCFELIALNPPIRAGKTVVYGLFEQSYAHLQLGGMLYVVIRKQQGAPSAQTELHRLFGNCERLTRENGFWILRCIKETSI